MDPDVNQSPNQPDGNIQESAGIPLQQPVEQTQPNIAPQEPQVIESAPSNPEVVPVQPVHTTPMSSDAPGSEQGTDPGKTLAIISIVLAFFFALAGLIVALIARGKSKKAGFKNTLATVGIVISSVFLVLSVLLTFFVLSLWIPAIKARSVAVNFSSAIRQGEVDKALQYAEVESTDRDSIKAYFLALSQAIGDSQQEVDSAKVDDTQVFVYTVTNGTNKYYRVVVRGDKVVNASTSDTQLNADTTELVDTVETE